MVKSQRLLCYSLFLVFMFTTTSAAAEDLTYHLEHEGVKIWINQDGTIDLLYDITISCDSGTLHWVEIGQPNGDFTVGTAFDEYNNELTVEDTSSQGNYKARIDVQDLHAGETVRFNLTTNVGHMIWQDKQNPGNVGLQFTPSWFPVTINILEVQIILPSGVTNSNVKTMTGMNWTSAGYEDGSFYVYWQRSSLTPNRKYTFGVSFPKEFVEQYETEPDFLETYGLWIVVLAVLAVTVGVVAVVFRKKKYLNPSLSVEALGIKRGLTAVEASHLLDFKPSRIVTEILFSLLKKRVVWVSSAKPSVKLEILKDFKNLKPAGLAEASLRYYEIDFMRAIKKDGTLDEETLAETISFLGGSVEEKLRGYCRRDTVNYYRKIVEKAWEQVRHAGTSEQASNLYDEQLLWLLLDPQHQDKTETIFESRLFEPSPLWLWYWYTYQHYHPNPKYEPNIESPKTSTTPPKIPGSEFADNIATAVENTSNTIVANMEKFANAIVPSSQPPKTSREPTHHKSSCVCACAACACVCACVSCACACASGGAG